MGGPLEIRRLLLSRLGRGETGKKKEAEKPIVT